MKKLSKLILSNYSKVLANRELKALLGGYDGDINNNNGTDGCKCEYQNRRGVNNNNEVVGCWCSCIKQSKQQYKNQIMSNLKD